MLPRGMRESIKCLVVLLAVAAGVHSQWQYMSFGPPQVHLADAAAASMDLVSDSCRPAGAVPQNWDQVGQAVSAVASASGLALGCNTWSDGNCGPDSVLRNLERLRPCNAASQAVLKTLAEQGRHSAIQQIRRLAGRWMRRHSSHEILPATSLETWVMMENRYVDFRAYVHAMEQDTTWVETPFFLRAARSSRCSSRCLWAEESHTC